MNYISSIQNVCPGQFIVCRHPVTDFNDGTILTVNPGETAIFVNNGQITGVFSNGRYELTTQNYPFINAFRRFLANGQSTYRCFIYYVSEVQSTEILWGFPLSVRDPLQNIATKIFCRGAYSLRVKDGGTLLLQLLGMNVNFMAAQDFKLFFGNKFQQQISNLLAKYINSKNQELIATCSDNLSISEEIEPKLAEIIASYGLELMNFSISAMQIDESDPNRRFLEQAYAKSREMRIMGGDYSTIKENDILAAAAQTPFSSLPRNTVNKDFVAKLKQLQEMVEMGLITQHDYETGKAKLLNDMI